MIGAAHPVARAAQKILLVVGAGVLSAAVCSTGVRVSGVGEDDDAIRAAQVSNTPSMSPRTLPAEETEALRSLRRAAEAESSTSYSGTKFFSSWSATGGESALAKIRHVPGRGTYLELLSPSASESGDSSHGDPIVDIGVDLTEKALSILANHYRLKLAEFELCLGRPVSVVEATKLDGVHPSGRFWIDDETGLVLRRELYDNTGKPIGASAFLDITVSDPASGAMESPSTDGTIPGALDQDEVSDLREDGWRLPNGLPGGFALYSARAVKSDASGDPSVVQLAYTDGLFAVSLFAQRGRLDAAAMGDFSKTLVGKNTAYSKPGLYRHVIVDAGDMVYTLVSDAPDTKVDEIISSLPHHSADPGLLSRVARGIDRVATWINPFD